MESNNNKKNYREKTTRDSSVYTKEQRNYGICQYKGLQTGDIIECACRYEDIDHEAATAKNLLGEQYIRCYFFVVKGPTYHDNSDDMDSNAIVLKINTNPDYENSFRLDRNRYTFLDHDSYISSRSIPLAINSFKMLSKKGFLHPNAFNILIKILGQFAGKELELKNEKEEQLKTAQQQNKSEQEITQLKKQIKALKNGYSNAINNADILKRSLTEYEKRHHEEAQHCKSNNNFRGNNGYRGRGRSGYNRREYQQMQPHNYNSFYNRNYQRGRGRGGYGNNSGYNYYK